MIKVDDQMLSLLRRLLQQNADAELRFKIDRFEEGLRCRTVIGVRVFINGVERGGNVGTMEPLSMDMELELKRFMELLLSTLSNVGID